MRQDDARKLDLSTPQQKCIGWPEQKYIIDAGKKAPDHQAPVFLRHSFGQITKWQCKGPSRPCGNFTVPEYNPQLLRIIFMVRRRNFARGHGTAESFLQRGIYSAVRIQVCL
jgi:hypothetical protein